MSEKVIKMISFFISLSFLNVITAIPVAVPAPFPGGVGPDGTRYKTAYRCEGQRLELTCGPDHKISIIRANFGRFSIAICNKHGQMDMSVNCMAPASTRVMKKRCDGFDSCAVNISSNLFGDPCPSTPKYLEVHYGCVPTSTTTTRKPLPPWFLEVAGEQNNQQKEPDMADIQSSWDDARIPDPPEGFNIDEDEAQYETEIEQINADVQEQDNNEIVKMDPVDLERIPITTPTIEETESTTNTKATTKLLTDKTSTELSEEGMEYYPHSNDYNDVDNNINKGMEDIEVKIVDIPVEDRPLYCPPTMARNLHWNWTRAGETSIQRCPPGSTGLARWTCAMPGPHSGNMPVSWQRSQPDLGDCKTIAMSRLETKVQTGEQENVISFSLAHLSRTESLYGGDIEQSAAVMRTLANRIQYLLQTKGDTFYDKGVYIQEVLLNMVRAASNLFDLSNRAAWNDLNTARQVKAATSITQALEENGFLLAQVTSREEILTESARNIFMSVSVQNVGRFRTNGTVLGSRNPDTENANTVFVPYNVLVEQSRSGVVKTVLFAYNGLEYILDSTNVVLTTNKELFKNSNQDLELVSRVSAVSFGRRRRLQYPDTVEVTLHHVEPSTVGRPIVCVNWNPELAFWTDAGCSLLDTDENKTVCRCDRTGMFALAAASQSATADDLNGGNSAGISLVTLQIVTYIVATISIICIILILVKFRRGLARLICKISQTSEKHVCNPKSNNGDDHTIIHNNLQQTLGSGGKGPEFVVQREDGTVTIVPNMYNMDNTMPSTLSSSTTLTSTSTKPVMVTLNPYSSQLVDNLNRMMMTETPSGDLGTMNPALARLTATLRKKRCELGHVGPCRQTCLLQDNHGSLQQLMTADGSKIVSPNDVVFRAVSPHGHVYCEINPKKMDGQGQMTMSGNMTAVPQQDIKTNKSQNSTSTSASGGDDNTTSDLQNISDFSDDDHRAHSEMSRQSSSRFSESRPLIYTSGDGSTSSTSPGHSAASDILSARIQQQQMIAENNRTNGRFNRAAAGTITSRWLPAAYMSSYNDDVYAYAATDFSNSSNNVGSNIPEHFQSQVQIKDIRAVPVSVKSKEYIMAKIADYTERSTANHV